MKEKKIYLFDVDGTLTPSRERIHPTFEKFMIDFCERNIVYIATGSDRQKTMEQLGETLISKISVSYHCSGNERWQRMKNTYSKPIWNPNQGVIDWLNWKFRKCEFPQKDSNPEIHSRPGTLNFSFVSTFRKRPAFVEWDRKTAFRIQVVNEYNNIFTDSISFLGGQTSLDIFPKGNDKSQIVRQLPQDHSIIFYGDNTQAGGNDYTLTEALKDRGDCIINTVSSWKETYQSLLEEVNER